MNRVAFPALLAFALFVPSCGGDEGAEATGAPRETIEIAAKDFAFEPSTVDVDKPGVYSFRLVNRGESTHALEIEGEGVEAATAEIGPGESADVKVELSAGTYELYCPVDGHRDRGMEGTVSVGGAAPGGGTTTTQEDSGGGYDY